MLRLQGYQYQLLQVTILAYRLFDLLGQQTQMGIYLLFLK